MTGDAGSEEVHEPPRRPGIGWRMAVNVVLALTCLGMAFSEVLKSSCSTDAACRARDVILPLVALGPWVALLTAAVLWGFLTGRSPRAAWPANASLAFAALMLLALPVFGVFRDGWAGRTSAGRARIHADARGRIVTIVDETVRAVAPSATPSPLSTPGARDVSGDDACEHEIYQVEVRVPTTTLRDLRGEVARYWRERGYAVREASGSVMFVSAGTGNVGLSFSGDERDGRATFFAGGPCLRLR